MKSKSHYYLGTYLLSAEYTRISGPEQAAFLFGCLEPDWNILTYLRGSLKWQWLRGHNFLNMLQPIQNLIRMLRETEEPDIVYYFRLGKLMHYLTDAFTYPHNPLFSGTLREHRRYEAELESLFLKNLPAQPVSMETDETQDPFTMFLNAHRIYMNGEMKKQRDIFFSIRVVSCIFHELYRQPAAGLAKAVEQNAYYESPVHF